MNKPIAVVDGLVIEDGDRVLFKGQPKARNNGVYEVRRVQARICDIGPELKGSAMAKVAQRAVEALTVLPVHGLITDMESRKLAQRIQRYVAKYGMSLITTGFKQYAIRRLEEDTPKKASKKK